MPLYQYLCRCCGKSFEMLRRMQDRDRDLRCPNCQSDKVQPVFSSFSTGACGTSASGKFR